MSKLLNDQSTKGASFIKPLPNHWKPADFAFSGACLVEPVQHIAKTVCLLESRCDDYADYLRAMFVDRDSRWNSGVDQWNFEECQHGELLQMLCLSVDPEFCFDSFMERYSSLVSYHAPTGHSVRGSIGAELVSRCVVEALASTLYRVLADVADSEESRRVFSALAQDESRHFGMFLRMLDAEATATGGLGMISRFRHTLRRMIDLEDSQIMVASCIVAHRGDGPIQLRREAHWYLSRLYSLYRWNHLQYASRMLLMTLNMRPNQTWTFLCTFTLWTGIRLRQLWGRALALRLSSSANVIHRPSLS